jgi:hypothetical protein
MLADGTGRFTGLTWTGDDVADAVEVLTVLDVGCAAATV